ncbi:protein Cep78 homolog [Linepithema humile]|uniref:protein Cep78 homolog n=1 Tax=Linepithema humile TaxID=83485 RepID=UPI0006232ABC|nr:PREDICTED: protein Cep78 homolog [Linepithema humile]XP_012230152.1 PREDICTED: protein Cep78 homolog [Linepithema humile]
MDWHSTCTFRRCARRDQQQPSLYMNFLLPYFVHSIAVCLRNSLMITNLILDGIPLAPKCLKILSDGLISNRNLRSLSLARCRISDAGCDILLENLQYNSSLHILNLSACCLTNRSAAYLSLFFKKRKADLLQHVWKESTLSRENISTTTEGGLQVLILDRNDKFGDVGLRQLMRTLKNDFWLKKLHLRCCGITQHGAEIVLEFLQTNSVLAQIDLRDNELPVDMLRTICNILKRKKSKRKIILTKKRLLSHKYAFMQDMITKNSSLQRTSKENISSNNQTYFQSKTQHDYSSQIHQPMHMKKTKEKSNGNCQSHIIKKNYIKWTNADELKKCLSFMIEHNQELITELENTTDFLTREKNCRLHAEEAYQKIQPQLENLRNKIAVQNSIHSNMCCKNQVYINLQNVFKKFKIFTNEKMMEERSLKKKVNRNRINSIVY